MSRKYLHKIKPDPELQPLKDEDIVPREPIRVPIESVLAFFGRRDDQVFYVKKRDRRE